MDWTDLYYRQLARMISRHTWLYTEMVVDQTILHTPHLDKFLWCAGLMQGGGAATGCRCCRATAVWACRLPVGAAASNSVPHVPAAPL